MRSWVWDLLRRWEEWTFMGGNELVVVVAEKAIVGGAGLGRGWGAVMI